MSKIGILMILGIYLKNNRGDVCPLFGGGGILNIESRFGGKY
jgi:hypothetical protein